MSRSQRWFAQGLTGFALALLMAAPATWVSKAHAQGAPPDEAADTPPAQVAPVRSGGGLFSGPSLQETGRIAGAGMQSRGGAAWDSNGDDAVNAVGDSGEKSVQAVAARDELPQPAAGTVDQRRFEAELRAHLAALSDCRIDVARRRQVALADVKADTLTLRWIVRPAGDVAGTQVVATSPTDLGVMDCVKSRMSTWSFATRPRGGSLHLERAFTFPGAKARAETATGASP